MAAMTFRRSFEKIIKILLSILLFDFSKMKQLIFSKKQNSTIFSVSCRKFGWFFIYDYVRKFRAILKSDFFKFIACICSRLSLLEPKTGIGKMRKIEVGMIFLRKLIKNSLKVFFLIFPIFLKIFERSKITHISPFHTTR
jgi:hypothetical protein